MDSGQVGCRIGEMKDRTNAVQENCSTGGIQDRRESGLVGCRACRIQDRWDAGQVGCRTGGMQAMRERWDA